MAQDARTAAQRLSSQLLFNIEQSTLLPVIYLLRS